MKKWIIVFALVLSCMGWFVSSLWLQDDYTSIPLTFDGTHCPVLPVHISGSTYPLVLDLGSLSFLTLDANLLSHLEKKKYGSTPWMDLKGNHYESARYLLSQIDIGGIPLREVLVDEQEDVFFEATKLVKELKTSRSLGSIGRPLLKRINLFLDCPHAQLILTNSTKRLRKAGFAIENMTPVPFTITRVGLVFSVETDLGTKQLMLDTGATLTLLRSSLLEHHSLVPKEEGLLAFSSSVFKLGGNDFGNQDLYRFDLVDALTEIDGVLGMDFIKTHPLYIDYPNRLLYIGPKT